jgi:hypothetical protein
VAPLINASAAWAWGGRRAATGADKAVERPSGGEGRPAAPPAMTGATMAANRIGLGCPGGIDGGASLGEAGVAWPDETTSAFT